MIEPFQTAPPRLLGGRNEGRGVPLCKAHTDHKIHVLAVAHGHQTFPAKGHETVCELELRVINTAGIIGK